LSGIWHDIDGLSCAVAMLPALAAVAGGRCMTQAGLSCGVGFEFMCFVNCLSLGQALD
jgi:hypothetical protein